MADAPTDKPAYDTLEQGLEMLPSYARSLLKVSVPVRVTIASIKKPVGSIVNFGPGSVIQFNKSCEDTLVLEVNNHVVARGEAVKVGENYGLKVTDVVLPDERFSTVRNRPSS